MDTDWAPEYMVRMALDLLISNRVKATIFLTGEYNCVREYSGELLEFGIHPNFAIDINDPKKIIDSIKALVPNARGTRSHNLIQSTPILSQVAQAGLSYDCSHIFFQVPYLSAYCDWNNLVRIPYFWEDDTHWIQTVGDWQLRHYLDAFTSPGLKIINVHPFMIAANIPSEDYYLDVKQHIRTLSNKNIDIIRYNEYGARTFLIKLLEFLKSKNKEFHTLHDLYKIFPIKTFLTSGYKNKNRQIIHTKEDY